MDYTEPLKHCPSCGSMDLIRERQRLLICRNCGFHYYMNVAAAAAIFLFNPEGQALFILRARDPGKGKLGLPGGFVDPGEPLEDGLRREIREEVGLEIDPATVDFVASFPNQYPYKQVIYPAIDLYFQAFVESFDQAEALDEVDGLVVKPLVEVEMEELAFPSLRKVVRVLLDG